MNLKSVIFDMDGVLVDSMKYHIQSWIYSFNKFEIYPTNEDLALLEGMSYKETINFILKKYNKNLTNEKKEKLYKLKKKRLNEIFQIKIYEDVKTLLDKLKEKNIKLGLVSGANREFVKKIIEREFKNYFEVIITGEDVQKGKPNPEPYLKAVEKLNCKNDEIVVIENAPLGIESAKRAQLKIFALTTTLNKKYLLDADRIFNSHKELILYLNLII